PSGGKPFERGDFRIADRGERCDARTDFLAIEQDRTGSALSEATAEFGAGEFQIVAQDVEERRIAGGVNFAAASVYSHGCHAELLRGMERSKFPDAPDLKLYAKPSVLR